jgi:transposase InsO family protein
MPPWSGDPGRARGLSRHLRGAAHLAATGIRVGRKRVALLMSAAGIAGVSRRKFVTTTAKGSDRQAPDLVDRNFTAARPNLLWVADITYIPTWAGFLYLAVVLDAYSRRIVGWSMATNLATRLVLDALNRRSRSISHHTEQRMVGAPCLSVPHSSRPLMSTQCPPMCGPWGTKRRDEQS